MKGLKSLMKNISARRLSGSSSSSGKKRRASNMKRDNGASSATEDSSRCSLNSAGCSPAPWRVERLRIGAPDEQDWWKDDEEDDTTYCLSGLSGSMDDTVDENVSHNNKTMVTSPSSLSTATDGSPKKFHNCGFETWQKSREAWTARPEDASKNIVSKGQPVNKRELGKLLTKASGLRTCELPRRIPLTDLVESYVTVWNGDD